MDVETTSKKKRLNSLDRALLQEERMTELKCCCIGSHAALAMLRNDRDSLTDEELQKILARLNEVINEDSCE